MKKTTEMKKMKILIATGNMGKKAELLSFFEDLKNVEWLDFSDFPEVDTNCEETADTFEGNAVQKAKFFYDQVKIPVLAEDSGVEIDALKGELGVKTRRWGAGENATDAEWIDFFLKRMEKEEVRSARFFATICFFDGTHPRFFAGKCEGKILQETTCEIPKGIPLSAFFVPQGQKKTIAEMSKDEKKGISHRGNAAENAKIFLQNLIF